VSEPRSFSCGVVACESEGRRGSDSECLERWRRECRAARAKSSLAPATLRDDARGEGEKKEEKKETLATKGGGERKPVTYMSQLSSQPQVGLDTLQDAATRSSADGDGVDRLRTGRRTSGLNCCRGEKRVNTGSSEKGKER
jgi:hypothetical protein